VSQGRHDLPGGLMGWSDGSHMRQGGKEAATGRALTSVCHTPQLVRLSVSPQQVQSCT
jgi:hypothetical protein